MNILQAIIDSLKSDLQNLEDKKSTLTQKLNDLSEERKIKVKEIICTLVPDISRKTLFILRDIVPEFKVMTRFIFFDFYEVINTSIEEIRMDLEKYLEKNKYKTKIWVDKIIPIDNKSYFIKNNEIPEIDDKIKQLSDKIESYENLANMRLDKMETVLKDKIEKLKNPERYKLTESECKIQEIWLNHELFSRNSPLRNEISRLEKEENNCIIFIPNYITKNHGVKSDKQKKKSVVGF